MIELSRKIVDISYANAVDFKALKDAGVTGVIIRAGYLGKTDTRYRSHIEAAINVGMDIGAYCYIMADNIGQERDEADEICDLLRPYRMYINLPVYADLEHDKYVDRGKSFDYHRSRNTALVKTFCDWCNNHGYASGVYTNPAMLSDYYNIDKLPRTFLWLAHWTNSPRNVSPYLNKYQPVIWQWGTATYGGLLVDTDIADKNIVQRVKTWQIEHGYTT